MAGPSDLDTRRRTGAGPGHYGGHRSPAGDGPVGRVPQAVQQLRWEAVRGCWVWCVPGRQDTLHLVFEDWGSRCHRLRESQRYTALLALERRRPATFGGWGAEVCGLASGQGMTVASPETELSLLRALQAGAMWTGERARSHEIGARATCLYCGRPTERRDRGPPPLGRPTLPSATGCLAAAGARRSRPAASLGHAVSVASVPAGNRPPAGGARAPGGRGLGGAAHVLPLRNVLGGTVGAYASGSRDTSIRGRRPLGFCRSAQKPSRRTTRLPSRARADTRRRRRRRGRRWPCARARRRGGRGRHPSRWRSCGGPVGSGSCRDGAT